jgi:hypothetical protein
LPLICSFSTIGNLKITKPFKKFYITSKTGFFHRRCMAYSVGITGGDCLSEAAVSEMAVQRRQEQDAF